MLRVRTIDLCAHNIYSANHEDLPTLKQLGRHIYHNIYIAADPTPVSVDDAAHAVHYIVRPQCLGLLSESFFATTSNQQICISQPIVNYKM